MTAPTRRIRLHAETTEDGRGLARLSTRLDAAADSADKLGASMERVDGQAKHLGDSFGEAAGGAANKAFANVLDLGGRGLRPRNALIAGLVGGIVALSPMIGAMIAGAVTGAVGVGGIAGGIASASRDPRVREAASKFSRDMAGEFFRGDAFVQPTTKALSILSGAFKDMDLSSAFAKLAPHVQILAEGLGAMLRNIMPGLNEAFSRMGPFIDALADGLAEMGTQLGDFFNRLSRSEGAVLGLETAFLLLNGTIQALGVTIEFLSNVYVRSIDFMISATGALEDILTGPLADAVGLINDKLELLRGGSVQAITATNQTGEAANRASAGWVTYADSVEIAAGHQEDLNRALEDSISNMLAQDNANIGLAQAMADFGETLKENGRQWDINTEKGRANSRGLLDSVGAAERKRQADIKMGIQMGLSAEEATRRANTAYNKTIEKLKDMARKAGITEAALKDLVGDYKVTVHYRTTGSFYVPPSSVLEKKGRQHGGPVLPGVPYEINEAGRETVTFPAAGTVHPAHLTPAAGSRQQPILLQLQIGQRVIREVLIDDALLRGVPSATVRAAYP